MTTEIIVALIGVLAVAVAGLPATLIERARRENSQDHARVRTQLERIDEHLSEIEDSVDDVAEALRLHVEEHDV